MGMAMNLMILYFCILFGMWLSDPTMGTSFTEVLAGRFVLNINTIVMGSISGIAGIIVGLFSKDLMTGVITALATTMLGWFVIPVTLFAGAPYGLDTFMTGLLALIWNISIMGFIRGYEA